MPSANDIYARRIARVLHHIGDNLHGDLSLEALSRVAGFSPHHFHRQFRDYVGVPVGRFIALMRLKRAAVELALDANKRVIDVALDAGFEAPESFARAFKRAVGQSPSSFRHNPGWERWAEVFAHPVTTRSTPMDVQLVDFPATPVAVLEHRGSPATLMSSVQRFIAWRKSCDVSPNATSKTIGIAYDDPRSTAPEDFRFDICGQAHGPVPANDHGVVEKLIPGGPCAMVRHLGSTDAIGPVVQALYGQWLPRSGRELRDFPCFFHYVARMPTVSEHDQITDLYLPLKPLT